MTAPRRILPAKCYFATRRTSQRMFMTPPDETTKKLFGFCLALAAERFGIAVMGWCVMSNHYHLIVYDEKANIPAFLQLLNRLLASTGNARWKRLENFWSSEPACIVLLVTEEDLLEKLVYTLANPVTAQLVDTIEEWPNSSLEFLDGQTRTFERPDLYFSRKSRRVRAEITLRIVQPPESAKKESFEAWAARVKKRVAEVNADAAALRKVDPTFRSIGMKKVLASKHTDRPPQKDEDDDDAPPKPKLRPHVACQDPEALVETIKATEHFRTEHRDARLELADPNFTGPVTFPEGTYHIPPGGRVVIGKRDERSAIARATKRVWRVPSDPIDPLFLLPVK